MLYFPREKDFIRAGKGRREGEKMETPHVLTCLSGSTANEKVVRLAASLAQGIGAIFTALYVEPAPGGLPKGQSAEVLQNNILLA